MKGRAATQSGMGFRKNGGSAQNDRIMYVGLKKWAVLYSYTLAP
jgi:hypothetical protein